MVKVNIIEEENPYEANLLYHKHVDILNIFIKRGHGECRRIGGILEIDTRGDLVEIEIISISKLWKITDDIRKPEGVIKSTVILETEDDDVLSKGEETYYTNKSKDFLYIQIEKEKPSQNIEVVKNIILEVTDNGKLNGIWILDLPKNIP